MTAETFHDALGLLPADLITAADKVRSRPRQKKVHWVRWASMAACVAVILYGGFLFQSRFFSADNASADCSMEGDVQSPASTQAAAASDAAPQETADAKSQSTSGGTEQGLTPTGYPADGSWYADLSATQYCVTPLPADSTVNTSGSLQTVLITSLEALNSYCEKKSSVYDMSSFQEISAAYDDLWFAEHDLLLIQVSSILDEVLPEVRSLTKTAESTWEIILSQSFTTASAELTDWHILITVNKGAISESDTITVIIE